MLQKLIDVYLRAVDNHPIHHQVGTDSYIKSKKEYFKARDALKQAGIDPQEVSSDVRGRSASIRHTQPRTEDSGNVR